LEPSKAARLEATSFEALSTAAWAGMVSSELFFELLVAVNDSHSTLDLRFRWEAASSFTHRLESNGLRCARVRIALVRSGVSDQRSLLTSALARNRTWSDSFEDCHAIQHTRESC